SSSSSQSVSAVNPEAIGEKPALWRRSAGGWGREKGRAGEPDLPRLRLGSVKGTTMAASLGALRDDHVHAGRHGGTRLGHGCGGRPPRNPARLHFDDELFGVEAHNRRDDARIGLKHCITLGGEIGRGSLTRVRWHRRAPMLEKFAHPRFVYRIARR